MKEWIDSLVLFRSLVFHLWFLIVSVVMFLGAIPLFLGPRILVIRAAQLWAHLQLWGLRVFCGQTYEVRGQEYVPQDAALVAAKHYSMWETIAFMVLVDDPAIVLKRELLNIPLYGWYGSKMGMIGLDRSGKAKALRELKRVSEKAVADGRQIVIFPEGTRKTIGAAPDYKPGAAGLYSGLGVPCVPVAHNSGLFWCGGWKRHSGTILIEFLPAIPPGLRRAEFMRELEEKIETATKALLKEAGA